MTHTPGPWRFNGNWLEPVDGGELIITYTNADDGLHGTDEDKALLAAAPDLLAAGERLIAAYKAKQNWPDNDSTKAFDRMLYEVECAEYDMVAAIAKARNTPSLHIEVL